MKDSKGVSANSNARRNVLKSLVSGGGIVGAASITSWSKPVVESVLLPAHAATTIISATPQLRVFSVAGSDIANFSRAFNQRYVDSKRSESFLHKIIPAAEAQFTSGNFYEAVLVEISPGIFNMTMLIRDFSGQDCEFGVLVTGFGLTLGSSVSGFIQFCDDPETEPAPMQLTAVSDTLANVEIIFERDTFGGEMMIDPNAVPPTPFPCPCVDLQ